MLKFIFATMLVGINYFVLREAFYDRTIKEGFKWLLGLETDQKNPTRFSVTVLIPAYDEADFIEETISSLQDQDYPIKKILVVDDSSTDGTSEIARKAGVEVVTTPRNSGTKAQAQNFGLNFVDTDLVINVDADTKLEKESVRNLVTVFQDKEVAAASGFVIPRKTRSIWERARLVQYVFGISFFKEGQNLWKGMLVASGCFSAFRTDLLKGFGGFPDRTIAEDMDVTWEILKVGKKVKFVSDALCYPVSPSDYPTYKAQVERWYRGFFQNVKSHGLTLLRNKRVAFFVTWNIINGLFFPLQIGFVSFLLFRFGAVVLLGVLSGLAFLVSYSLLKARRFGLTTRTLTSLPAYLFVLVVNSYIFFRSFWLEWFRKENLRVWEKGHGSQKRGGG
ncbi:MAG: glycosyltransferase family 2 protein [Candidatus Bipolaricaulota bacterium]